MVAYFPNVLREVTSCRVQKHGGWRDPDSNLQDSKTYSGSLASQGSSGLHFFQKREKH